MDINVDSIWYITEIHMNPHWLSTVQNISRFRMLKITVDFWLKQWASPSFTFAFCERSVRAWAWGLVN